MSLFDSILGQVSDNATVKNLADKVGLDPAQIESAVASLANQHGAPGDTLQEAAAQTGLDQGKLSEIVDHIGGEGSLERASQMMQEDGSLMDKVTGFLDQNGDGSIIDDLGDMAKGFFGKK